MFSYQIHKNLKLTLSQQHHAEEITNVVGIGEIREVRTES
jgi:hypothetical protein